MITISYSGYRFPPEIIQHAIWLYIRFTLSFRDVEICWRNAGSWSPMRPSGAGGTISVRWSQRICANADPNLIRLWHLDEVYLKICRMEDFAVRTKIDGSESATSCQKLRFVARRSKPKPDAR